MSASPHIERDRDARFITARRNFMRFLAASPLLAAGALLPWKRPPAGEIGSDELGAFYVPDGPLIKSAEEAINVFDLEAIARNKMPPAHYGRIASGEGSGRTVVRNREGFNLFGIQSRRLIDVTKIDTRLELLGTRLAHPTVVAARGAPIWYQLYPTTEWSVTKALVRRAERAG
jgi:hypothetical protein